MKPGGYYVSLDTVPAREAHFWSRRRAVRWARRQRVAACVYRLTFPRSRFVVIEVVVPDTALDLEALGS